MSCVIPLDGLRKRKCLFYLNYCWFCLLTKCNIYIYIILLAGVPRPPCSGSGSGSGGASSGGGVCDEEEVEKMAGGLRVYRLAWVRWSSVGRIVREQCSKKKVCVCFEDNEECIMCMFLFVVGLRVWSARADLAGRGQAGRALAWSFVRESITYVAAVGKWKCLVVFYYGVGRGFVTLYNNVFWISQVVSNKLHGGMGRGDKGRGDDISLFTRLWIVNVLSYHLGSSVTDNGASI